MKRNIFVPLIIVLIILVTVVASLFGYGYALIQSDNSEPALEQETENKEMAPEEKREEEVKPVKNVAYTFKKGTEDIVEINNKKIFITNYYYADKEEFNDDILSNIANQKNEYYVLRREIFINNQKFSDSSIYNFYQDESDVLSFLDSLKDNTSSLKFLYDTKDNDQYLLLPISFFESTGLKKQNLYLINNEGVILKTINLSYQTTIPSEQNLNQELISDHYVAQSKTLHYLKEETNLNEYKVTIEHGIVKEELSNTYILENTN